MTKCNGKYMWDTATSDIVRAPVERLRWKTDHPLPLPRAPRGPVPRELPRPKKGGERYVGVEKTWRQMVDR